MQLLEPAPAARFRRSHVAPIKEMAARGALEQRAETVLYCEARRRYVVGCWLLGRCPLCDAEVGGLLRAVRISLLAGGGRGAS